jgi:hypothetical protein
LTIKLTRGTGQLRRQLLTLAVSSTSQTPSNSTAPSVHRTLTLARRVHQRYLGTHKNLRRLVLPNLFSCQISSSGNQLLPFSLWLLANDYK